MTTEEFQIKQNEILKGLPTEFRVPLIQISEDINRLMEEVNTQLILTTEAKTNAFLEILEELAKKFSEPCQILQKRIHDLIDEKILLKGELEKSQK